MKISKIDHLENALGSLLLFIGDLESQLTHNERSYIINIASALEIFLKKYNKRINENKGEI